MCALLLLTGVAAAAAAAAACRLIKTFVTSVCAVEQHVIALYSTAALRLLQDR
jgi:hypothetical protein